MVLDTDARRSPGRRFDLSEAGTANIPGSLTGGRAARLVLTETPAYRGGWRDGRFGAASSVPVEECDLSGLEGDDRQAYCRGYREGQRVRRMLKRG
jgi:hypothetical protein